MLQFLANPMLCLCEAAPRRNSHLRQGKAANSTLRPLRTHHANPSKRRLRLHRRRVHAGFKGLLQTRPSHSVPRIASRREPRRPIFMDKILCSQLGHLPLRTLNSMYLNSAKTSFVVHRSHLDSRACARPSILQAGWTLSRMRLQNARHSTISLCRWAMLSQAWQPVCETDTDLMRCLNCKSRRTLQPRSKLCASASEKIRALTLLSLKRSSGLSLLPGDLQTLKKSATTAD